MAVALLDLRQAVSAPALNLLAIENCSHKLPLANHSQENRKLYVCICNAIRESELRRVARHVSGDAEAAYAALGKRPNCGQCLMEADEILFEERELGLQPAAA